jgi:hypothetical protein
MCGSDAAEQGLAEEKALKKGMQKNPASSRRRAASFTRRRDFQVFLPATQALENLKTKNQLTIAPQ